MVIADKAGDVHRFSVSADSQSSELQIINNSLLLGHVSMLLDVVGTLCDAHYLDHVQLHNFCLCPVRQKKLHCYIIAIALSKL